ncbi:unnamed protein product, partial [Rotaria sordida]
NFYSLLLNANITYGKIENTIAPRIFERTSLWLRNDIIDKILKNEPNLLKLFLQRIESKLNEFKNISNDENDEHDDDYVNHQLCCEIEKSLQNFEYNHEILRCLWKTLITVANENTNDVLKKLYIELHNFITLSLIKFPLVEI